MPSKSMAIYTMAGEKKGEMVLPAELFAVEMNSIVVSRSVVSELAGRRKNYANTKTRAERRGGGIKPWKQKGTGRARAGSTRSPIWRKGGIIWGPQPTRNFTKKVGRKEQQLALAMALSAAAAQEKGLVLLEEFVLSEPKTKHVATLLSKLPVGKKATLVLPTLSAVTARVTRNLPNLTAVVANQVTPAQLLASDTAIITVEAIPLLKRRVSTVKVEETAAAQPKKAASKKTAVKKTAKKAKEA